jgi:hypothetical protein
MLPAALHTAAHSLDLSGLPLELRQLQQLATHMRQLSSLRLAGCKKLVPPLASALLWSHNNSTSSGAVGRQDGGSARLSLLLPHLQLLNLQRCFQLDSSCLVELLAASCHPASQMAALAVSHLDMRSWPEGGRLAAAVDKYQEQLQQVLVPAQASAAGAAAGGGCTGTDAADGGHPVRLPSPVQLPALGASRLRVLALNNCTMLTLPGLGALTSSCTALEYLFLGGASLAPVQRQVEAELGALAATAAAAAATAAGGQLVVGSPPTQLLVGSPPGAAAVGLLAYGGDSAGGQAGGAGGSSAEGEGMSPVKALWMATQVLERQLLLPEELPGEYVSSTSHATRSSTSSAGAMACGSSSGGGSGSSSEGEGSSSGTASPLSTSPPGAESAAARILSGLRRDGRPCRILAGDPNQLIRQHRERVHLPPGVAQELRCQGLVLAAALLQLPRLRAVEVSFFPAHVVGWLACSFERGASAAATAAAGGGLGAACRGLQRGGQAQLVVQPQRVVPEVWDLCTAAGVDAALHHLAAAKAAGPPCGSSRVEADRLRFALECSVNSSSRSRMTPLHAAAEAGDARRCRLLIGCGAQLAAKTNNGASPLFLACESGQVEAVHVLLEAGGDPLAGTTNGETPLYIAALRGHSEVVRALLGALRRQGVAWEDSRWYGDGWTPLMAAAVADRTAVVQVLLEAAGPVRAQQLLLVPNRYGQTVLHIAARKGSQTLLRLLMGAGGALGVRLPDAAGHTPLDVARRCRHQVAMAEFQSAALGEGSTCTPAIAGLA